MKKQKLLNLFQKAINYKDQELNYDKEKIYKSLS